MRVLTVGNMYPPHSHGGYEVLWQAGVESLRERGHEVRVLTTDFREPEAEADALPEDPDVHRELRWYWRDHEFPRMGIRAVIGLERHNARVLARHLSEFQPDAVAWWAMGGMSLALIERARRAGLPAVGVVIDDWLVYGPQVDRWSRLMGGRPRLAALAERATGLPALQSSEGIEWLVVSEATRDQARGGPLGVESCEVVPHGIDLARFVPAEPRPWEGRLLCLGRLDPRKGVDLAIAALSHLPQDTTLRIIGRGDPAYLDELRAQAHALGVAERVEFGSLPYEEVPAAYAAADAVLFPVRWSEPQGLVPLEAMAVGCPVVARATGGAAAFLRDGENSLLLGEGDGGEQIAARVSELAADPALRNRLRAGGRATAERFGHGETHRALEAALERAVARGAAP